MREELDAISHDGAISIPISFQQNRTEVMSGIQSTMHVVPVSVCPNFLQNTFIKLVHRVI